MDAKVDQLLHHREELHLEETLPNSQVSLENVVSTVQTLIITISFLSWMTPDLVISFWEAPTVKSLFL